MKLTLKLMETRFGDRYLVRNGYNSVTHGWKIGDEYWETIPKRNGVSPEKIAADKAIWECEMPTCVWDAINSQTED